MYDQYQTKSRWYPFFICSNNCEDWHGGLVKAYIWTDSLICSCSFPPCLPWAFLLFAHSCSATEGVQVHLDFFSAAQHADGWIEAAYGHHHLPPSDDLAVTSEEHLSGHSGATVSQQWCGFASFTRSLCPSLGSPLSSLSLFTGFTSRGKHIWLFFLHVPDKPITHAKFLYFSLYVYLCALHDHAFWGRNYVLKCTNTSYCAIILCFDWFGMRFVHTHVLLRVLAWEHTHTHTNQEPTMLCGFVKLYHRVNIDNLFAWFKSATSQFSQPSPVNSKRSTITLFDLPQRGAAKWALWFLAGKKKPWQEQMTPKVTPTWQLEKLWTNIMKTNWCTCQSCGFEVFLVSWLCKTFNRANVYTDIVFLVEILAAAREE